MRHARGDHQRVKNSDSLKVTVDGAVVAFMRLPAGPPRVAKSLFSAPLDRIARKRCSIYPTFATAKSRIRSCKRVTLSWSTHRACASSCKTSAPSRRLQRLGRSSEEPAR
jgi:hypothetical protein